MFAQSSLRTEETEETQQRPVLYSYSIVRTNHFTLVFIVFGRISQFKAQQRNFRFATARQNSPTTHHSQPTEQKGL
jgi:hypothetical protein